MAELVRVPDVTEGSPHVLDDAHVLERGLQGVCGRMHGVDHRVAGGLRGSARFLGGAACRLTGFTNVFANLARVLCQPAERFRLVAAGFGLGAARFLQCVVRRRNGIARHGRQSCRTTLKRAELILIEPLYSRSPSLRNLFMKKFTRERVVPIISASVSWEIFGKVRWGLGWP